MYRHKDSAADNIIAQQIYQKIKAGTPAFELEFEPPFDKSLLSDELLDCMKWQAMIFWASTELAKNAWLN